MTLIEALVAIAILSGVMATAIDTFRFAATRSAVSDMEVEAANLAESLLARAGVSRFRHARAQQLMVARLPGASTANPQVQPPKPSYSRSIVT